MFMDLHIVTVYQHGKRSMFAFPAKRFVIITHWNFHGNSKAGLRDFFAFCVPRLFFSICKKNNTDRVAWFSVLKIFNNKNNILYLIFNLMKLRSACGQIVVNLKNFFQEPFIHSLLLRFSVLMSNFRISWILVFLHTLSASHADWHSLYLFKFVKIIVLIEAAVFLYWKI